MTKIRLTKKAYREHLDQNAPPQGDERWIIGGKIQMYHMWKGSYGDAMQKHDPIAFEVGYRDWKASNGGTY